MARTVLITGAASGIGLATAKRFLALGDKVVLTDSSAENLHAATSRLKGQFHAMVADVRNEASLEHCFQVACEKFGPVGVVHANAGVSSMKRAIELTEADWDFNFAVNAKGVFFTNRIAVKHFLERRLKGVIVNTASLAAKTGAPLLAHYSASKFAVLGWTQALAREHARDGIRVNAVCPGFVKTPMQEREIGWEAQLLGTTAEKVRQSYIDQTPLGRLETPEDVAGVVEFLASDDAAFMTGQGINVTGGVFMN